MIGRKIGRYEIKRKLGEGGMGSVWLAEDPFLSRQVALKLIATSLMDIEGSRERFEREARIASGLKHPGIATVYDAGTDGDQDYIAFQHIEGRTLSDLILEGPLPIAQAALITQDAAEALHYAHTHGVIHRDVKSHNIIINQEGHAVVVDFGLALPEGETRLTMTGAVMGTPAYFAPEVARGDRADARSDIYGLGVVLYEMLTGKLPFTAEKQQAVIYKILNEEPPRASKSRSGMPPELDQVITRALQKTPGARYPSAAELGSAVATISPESPQGDLTRRLTGTFATPRRHLVWMGLIIAAAIVAAIWPSTPPRPPQLQPPSPAAVQYYEQGTEMFDTNLSRALGMFRMSVKESPDYVDAWIATGVTIRRSIWAGSPVGTLEEAQAAFHRVIELDPENIVAYRGLIRLAEDGEDALRQGNGLWNTGSRDYQTMMAMADAFRLGGLEDLSIPFLEEAIALAPDQPEPYYHLCYIALFIGDPDRAIEAGKVFLAKYGPDAEGSFWVGRAYHVIGDFESAKLHYDNALDVSGAKAPVWQFNDIGILYRELGLEEEARRIWNRGLDIYGILRAQSPDQILVANEIEAYVLLGQEEEAKALLETVDDETRATFTSQHFMTKQEIADVLLADIQGGDNPGVVFVKMGAFAPWPGLLSSPEYKEVLKEFYKLQKRLRDKYGNLDILKEYEPKFSLPG